MRESEYTMTTGVPKIYLNSYNYRGYPLARALHKAREYGYDGVDLWAGHYDVDTVEQTLREVQPLAESLGITVPILNLSGNVIGRAACGASVRLSSAALPWASP